MIFFFVINIVEVRSSRRTASKEKNLVKIKPTTQKELVEAAKRKSVPEEDLNRTVWLKGI